jgi:hypothetical protein
MIGMPQLRPGTICQAVVALSVLVLLLPFSKALARAGAPRTYNIYIENRFEPGDAEILSRYDVVALDVDSPFSVLNEIKSLNPAIKLLAYIPINGTYVSSPLFPDSSLWREMYEVAETNNWWLRDTAGNHIYDHVGKYTLNMTPNCPANASGQTAIDWWPGFITNSILRNGTAPWDGVLLDNVWIGIAFINNTGLNELPIDSDQDGIADDPLILNAMWKAGNDTVTARSRRTMPPDKLLTGNGGNQFYQMNGAMIETFPFNGQPEVGHPLNYTWNDKMFGMLGYFNNETYYNNNPVRLNAVNTKWNQGDRYNPVRTPEFERRKRFCLASTMLRDGYFSMDWIPPVGGHNSLWWEPEYDKMIGTPVGAPYQVTYGGMTLWRRDYTGGAVILNHNYTTFPGSAANGIPPIGWVDARILLTSEFWQPETNLPATINDLAVTRTWPDRIEVQWTNVGDDGMAGQALEVQVRYAATPITSANWSAATPFSPSSLPELPGTVQKQIVTGLSDGQLYYFAVKTRDLAGNWSLVSNSPSGTTVTGDISPPAPVTDLSILSTTTTGATVRWTTTGDDGLIGSASSFDLRYATFPLTSDNFHTGAAVVGEPAPGPSGTVRTMDLYGMTPSTTYYFAIKVGDEMPNWSPISNISTAATQNGDTTPPAAITDLWVTAIGSNSVTLGWTTPGDDGATGRAATYDLRISPAPITAGNFSSAGYIVNEPAPLTGGSAQSFTITGLGVGYTYYFAMKTADEFPNWSGMSNTVVVTTNTALDTTPPAAITNLAITAVTSTSATLSWTVPGDNGSTGTASSYDLRRSGTAITSTNFASATAIAGEPVPTAPGTTQTFTVTGLTAGATYYFSLKTADEVPNWSAVSNSPAGTTQAADTTPPSFVNNLAVTSTTANSVTLSWTVRGDDGTTGTATSYDLRYSMGQLNNGNFSGGIRVSGVPAPQAPGTTQIFTVTGLTPGTTYYFGLKTADEVPNWSTVSNSPYGTTTPPTASVPEDSLGSAGFRLSSPSPNPFRRETRVNLRASEAAGAHLSARVFDVQGHEVRLLHEGELLSGSTDLVWDGRDNGGRAMPSGVYFLIVTTGKAVQRLKLVRR